MKKEDGYRPCPLCGAPIDWSHYGGRLTAVDPDGGHHICPAPPVPSIMECICGTVVIDEGDTRLNWPTRTPHVHRPTERTHGRTPCAPMPVQSPTKPPTSAEMQPVANKTIQGIDL